MNFKNLVLVIASTLNIGACASVGAPRTNVEHGALVTRDDKPRMIAVGPVTLLAHTQDKGGAIYLVSAMDSETPCDSATAARTAAPVRVDRRNTVEVPAGFAACLATNKETSGYELLWFARREQAAEIPGEVRFASRR